MELGIVEKLVSLAAVLILGAYTYLTWTHDYWKKRGVPGPKPSAPFGNFADIFFRRKPLTEVLRELYEAHKNEPFFGYFVGRAPIFVVKDPELVKHVLIKDFHAFSDRGVKINEDVDPLSAHLFNIGGERWKVLRHKLTPVFTTGKLKHMFSLMNDCADNLERHLKERVARRDQLVECREQAARYSTDVIGSCAFGIDTQALSDENSVFRTMGRKIFRANFGIQMRRLMRHVAPRIYGFLRLATVPPEVTEFFINTMKQTIEARERDPRQIARNDFVDALMRISEDSALEGVEWTNHLLTAQAFVFFAAGFETSSTTISFALWELARSPDSQEKLRREVLEFDRKRNAGKITYESVNEMKYLDMVVKETLRKNPPVVVLVRKVTRDYAIPGTKVTLEAGVNVQIPVYTIHRDPDYYPQPDVFDPERFADEEKAARHPMVFLPFGDGPKNCIGSRFGYYQVKLALIKIMKNFRVHPTTKSDEPYVIDKDSIVLAPVGGITLRFEPLS